MVAKKHEILTATFNSHLFNLIFIRGEEGDKVFLIPLPYTGFASVT